MLRGVRIFLRGLSDTLENLLSFVVLSFCFWICVFTIFLAPGAIVTLFAAADPRVTSAFDRPGFRAFFSESWRNFRRGWKLTFVTGPVLAILIHNLWFYRSANSDLSFLAPAWILLLLVGSLVATAAYSVMALFNETWRASLKIGTILTGGRLGQFLGAGILLWVLIFISSLLVVPVFLFLPATIAATVNRLTLTALNVPITDPLTPTDERRIEESASKTRRRWGP